MGLSAKSKTAIQLEAELMTLVDQPVSDPHSEIQSPPTAKSQQTKEVELDVTIDYQKRNDRTISLSSGLQIRCPHCSNGVELLAETAFEDISCNDCGSTFNLVDREEMTAAAAALKTIGRFKLEVETMCCKSKAINRRYRKRSKVRSPRSMKQKPHKQKLACTRRKKSRVVAKK